VASVAWQHGYEHVACCVEGPDAGPSLDEAVRIASLGGARLSVVHVADTPSRFAGGRSVWSPPEEAIAAGILEDARPWLERLAAGSGGAEAVLLQGSDPAEEILAWARRAACDLLVVHPRRSGVVATVLGSVTARLVREAPCPVMVVPPPGQA
jgi:nucleotide-binding universal stress UspA family protein